MKRFASTILLIIVLVGAVKVLNTLNEKEYQKAVSKCGSKENVITKYTNQGDKYYICK